MEKYIYEILLNEFQTKDKAIEVYNKSELLQYFNLKSNAIYGNVKTRRSLANWYSLYGILYFYKKYNFTNDKEKYLNFEGNIIFEGGDNAMQGLARDHLGYQHNKGLDFIAKFDDKYIIGEAKFLTDFGGHQNAQLADALNVIRSEFKDVGKEVIKIAILDGVLYIPNRGKMYQQLLDAKEDEVIISALLLRDFLYSL